MNENITCDEKWRRQIRWTAGWRWPDAAFQQLIITTLMYLIFFARKSSQKYHEGRYVCNRGPEGANYEVICPRAVTVLVLP